MCKAKLALVWLGRSLPACHRADCHEMTCVRDAHIANTRQSPPPPPKQPDSRAQRRPKIVDNVSRRFHVCANTARARVRRAAVSARLTAAGGVASRLGARGAAASPCGCSPEARFGARCGAAAFGWVAVCLCLGASAARLWSERRPSRSHHRGHTQSGVWGQP